MKPHCLLAFALASFVFPLTSLCQDSPAKPAPDEPVYYVNGWTVKGPRPIYAPDPEFPEKARKEHPKEKIVLRLVIGSNGLPRDIRVQRSPSPELDEAAITGVKKWKFAPATKDGQPVAVKIDIEIMLGP
jgi:TonB family protein